MTSPDTAMNYSTDSQGYAELAPHSPCPLPQPSGLPVHSPRLRPYLPKGEDRPDGRPQRLSNQSIMMSGRILIISSLGSAGQDGATRYD